MKTANLIKKTLIISILLFTVISCKNFMNSGDFLTSLEENIKIINSPKFTVLFEMDNNGYGTLNYIGYTECYIGQTLEVKFAENQTYKLDHWYFSSQDQIEVETNEEDLTQIKIKFNANAQDLVIKPVCVLRNDAIAPVFNSFIVKQPDTKPLIAGNEDRILNLNHYSKWSANDYENNHVNSLVFNFVIQEEGINISDDITINIKETLIQDVNGNELEEVTTTSFNLNRNDYVKDNRYPNIFSINNDLEENNSAEIYNFTSIYDGLIKMEITCSDKNGNISPVKTFYVIKDTQINIKYVDCKTSYSPSSEINDNFIKKTSSVYIGIDGFSDKWFENYSTNIDLSQIDMFISKNTINFEDNLSDSFIQIDKNNYFYTDNNFEECSKNDENCTFLGINLRNYKHDNKSLLFHYVDKAGNSMDKIIPILYSSQITDAYKKVENQKEVLYLSQSEANRTIYTDAESFCFFICGYKIKNGEKSFITFTSCPYELEQDTEYHLFRYDYNYMACKAAILSNEVIFNTNTLPTSPNSTPDGNNSENLSISQLLRNDFGNDIKVIFDKYKIDCPSTATMKMYYTKEISYHSIDQIRQLPCQTIIFNYTEYNNQYETISFPCDNFDDTNYNIYIEFVYKKDNILKVEIRNEIIPANLLKFQNVYLDNGVLVQFKNPINLPSGYITDIDYNYKIKYFNNNQWNLNTSLKNDCFNKAIKFYSTDLADTFVLLKSAPFYIYKSNSNFECKTHYLTDYGDFVTVASDCPVLVHTVYSPRNFKNDIEQWEGKTSDEHIVNTKQLGTKPGNLFMQDYVIDTTIPDADTMYDHYYYVVIAHFADGKSLMSEVKYK